MKTLKQLTITLLFTITSLFSYSQTSSLLIDNLGAIPAPDVMSEVWVSHCPTNTLIYVGTFPVAAFSTMTIPAPFPGDPDYEWIGVKCWFPGSTIVSGCENPFAWCSGGSACIPHPLLNFLWGTTSHIKVNF